MLLDTLRSRMGIAGELLTFFWQQKWWWLTPMILVLLLFGGLVIFAQSAAIAPFIYTLFQILRNIAVIIPTAGFSIDPFMHSVSNEGKAFLSRWASDINEPNIPKFLNEQHKPSGITQYIPGSSMNSLDLEAIVFDFDGVLTDNRVYVDQEGREMVCCNRSDGLAFDVLRKSPLKLYILSTETNSVVSARAGKLKIPVMQVLNEKRAALHSLAREEGFLLRRTMFVGNDLNDLQAMQACGVSACPSDSHPKVMETATFRLKSRGGEGVVRELVEEILKIEMLTGEEQNVKIKRLDKFREIQRSLVWFIKAAFRRSC